MKCCTFLDTLQTFSPKLSYIFKVPSFLLGHPYSKYSRSVLVLSTGSCNENKTVMVILSSSYSIFKMSVASNKEKEHFRRLFEQGEGSSHAQGQQPRPRAATTPKGSKPRPHP